MAEKRLVDDIDDLVEIMGNELEDYSIDAFLRALIKESDLVEVVCCLDMIAAESEKVIIMMNQEGREYPAQGVPLRELGFVKQIQDFNSMADIEDKSPSISDDDIDSDFGREPVDMTPENAAAVHEIYKGGFFKNRHKLSWRAIPVCQALIETFNLPKGSPLIDVGCAIGDYVKQFQDTGYPAWGIEGSKAAEPFLVTKNIEIYDIRVPFDPDQFQRDFALAFSLEVAEHIELEFADVYLDNLCRLSENVLITAAPPGQEGHGHVNCQEKEWWTRQMESRNYQRMPDYEMKFQNALAAFNHRKEVQVYSNNVMVFKAIHFTGRN